MAKRDLALESFDVLVGTWGGTGEDRVRHVLRALEILGEDAMRRIVDLYETEQATRKAAEQASSGS